MTEPIDMDYELADFTAEFGMDSRAVMRAHAGPVDSHAITPMTLAHLVAVLATLTPEQLEAVWKAGLPPVRMLADDYTDAEADRILAMTDEEIDAEIRAAGEDPASVRKWSKATGRWCSLLAQSTARTAEEKARADRAEEELADVKAALAEHHSTAVALHSCATAWTPGARLLGNITANELAALAFDVVRFCGPPKETNDG